MQKQCNGALMGLFSIYLAIIVILGIASVVFFERDSIEFGNLIIAKPYDMKNAITADDQSFLPLDQKRTTYVKALSVLADFVTAHPELEITGWRTEPPATLSSKPFISGILIYHKMKR